MSAMASQIIGVSMDCSTVSSGPDQRKHQSSASLAFVRGIHRWPVNFSHKRPVTRKMFPFDDVIMFVVQCATESLSVSWWINCKWHMFIGIAGLWSAKVIRCEDKLFFSSFWLHFGTEMTPNLAAEWYCQTGHCPAWTADIKWRIKNHCLDWKRCPASWV